MKGFYFTICKAYIRSCHCIMDTFLLLIVKHPREAALDAQCCASIANLGKQKAQALSTGFGSFSIAEFAEKLVCFFKLLCLYTVL